MITFSCFDQIPDTNLKDNLIIVDHLIANGYYDAILPVKLQIKYQCSRYSFVL